MRIEAKNLEQALMQAARELECSVVDIEYEVVQYHQTGFLGFFKKSAIIEAKNKKKHKFDKKFQKKPFNDKIRHKEKPHKDEHKSGERKANEHSSTEAKSQGSERAYTIGTTQDLMLNKSKYVVKDDVIFSSFHKESGVNPKIYIDEIRIQLEHLLKTAGFNIKIAELSVYDKNSIYIRLDGEDSALLIGKEAYRYKALSYLLHNWINSKYKLLIRLEIADFLRNQAQGVDFYLKGIVERVESTGRAQTKPLDGVLIKIALEKLRERFPNKYVGIRQNGEQKFIIINDFVKKDE